MPYNNLPGQSSLIPGMWSFPIGGTVNDSAVVPNSGGKTVAQIMYEIAHPTPGDIARIAGNSVTSGKDVVMSAPGFEQGPLAGLLEDAYDYYNGTKEQQPNDDPVTTPTSASQFGASYVNPVIDYLNADIAKHYGMSKETAYQEAMANSSYQRAVADMQRAGLNPATIFGAGRASGSGNVSYVSDNSASGFARNARVSSSDSFLGDVQLMESLGALLSLALGKSASSGKSAGKAISTIATKLENLSK